MARRGNVNRKPKGTPEGGQYTFGGEGYLIRANPVESDIESYLSNSMAGNPDPLYKRERVRNISKALYDGGYLAKTGGELNGFESPGDAEDFVRKITSEHATSEEWLEHKDMVETYLRVAKGYFDSGKFDLVTDGRRSDDGSYRDATGLMREFGLDKESIGKILLSLEADDFVCSGRNESKHEANKGTVVMIFSPRINLNGQKIDTYVKLVLNPHPDRERGQTEMQVISFKEPRYPLITLYKGEEHKCRK